MTNNKSERCEKCGCFPEKGLICLGYCPCHTPQNTEVEEGTIISKDGKTWTNKGFGDSLRKQCDCENGNEEDWNGYHCRCGKVNILKGTNQKCKLENCNVCVTPHESEDWDFEYAEFITEFERLLKEFPKEHHIAFNFGKKFMSKVYQRGREERDEFWKNQEMGVATDCWKHEEKAKSDILSLAVQEIEKEKKECYEEGEEPEFEDYEGESEQNTEARGFNQGLDKAKSIISGLKSKE